MGFTDLIMVVGISVQGSYKVSALLGRSGRPSKVKNGEWKKRWKHHIIQGSMYALGSQGRTGHSK